MASRTLRRLSGPQRLVFCAFDLLHLNGKDLRNHPLVERRAKLEELIPSEECLKLLDALCAANSTHSSHILRFVCGPRMRARAGSEFL